MTTDARAILGDIIAWQRATFGTTPRPAGLAKHIAKEAAECAAEPANLVEWLDVVFLGLHGAHSCAGADLDAILDGLAEKLAENERRTWKVPAGDVTVEHDRAGEHRSEPVALPPGVMDAFDALLRHGAAKHGCAVNATGGGQTVADHLNHAARHLAECNVSRDPEEYEWAPGQVDHETGRLDLEHALVRLGLAVGLLRGKP